MENINNLTISEVTNIVNKIKEIKKHPDFSIGGTQQRVSIRNTHQEAKELEIKYTNLAKDYAISLEDLSIIWNKYGNIL